MTGQHSAPHGAPIEYSALNQRDETVPDPPAQFDPLRLCVFTTIAAISAITGPLAVLCFALIAIIGYTKARRGGLLRSRWKLGDTRVVLAYLTVIALAAAVAIPFWFKMLLKVWG